MARSEPGITNPVAPSLSQVVSAVASLYPPALAEAWDAVGLVCGVPDRNVRRILVAVDPVAAVVEEALGGRRICSWCTTRCCCGECTRWRRTSPKARCSPSSSRVAVHC